MLCNLFRSQETEIIVDWGRHPLHIHRFRGVIARTNESQVGNLRYINKIVNSCILIIRTNICSPIYFSYIPLKMQSIKAHIPSPFPPDHLSLRVQTRVRSGLCRIKITYFIYLFLLFEQLHVLVSISLTARLKCSRLGHTSPPHSPLIICHIAYKRESGRYFAVYK